MSTWLPEVSNSVMRKLTFSTDARIGGVVGGEVDDRLRRRPRPAGECNGGREVPKGSPAPTYIGALLVTKAGRGGADVGEGHGRVESARRSA